MTTRLILLAAALCSAAAFAAEDFALTEIAPGVFVHQGQIAERTPANMGDQANIGFIVGKDCVAVIDTGGSVKVAQKFLAAIKAKTSVPICYVINTHVHPDHMFGNAAFASDKVTFVGHERLPAAMAARAQNYTNSLKRDLGEGAAGSEVLPPRQLVKDKLELDLGGRKIELRAWPAGHTDADVSIWDDTSGTLWLSDLVFMDHTPAMDGSILGWLKVIEQLKAIPAKQIVPGHGPVSAKWPQAVAAQEHYLEAIVAGVRQALKNRKTIQEAVEEVAWDEKGKWQQFENFHRRNVTASYAELEWEEE
jgi:quinoprotein relay system zinc metallohydrolase 2